MTLKQQVIVSFCFLFLNLTLDMWGDTNPRSRLALLAAIKEDGTFKIDPYKDWTIDWAQTPDGHYYSNKAPGPALLALPLYWVIDTMWTTGRTDRKERDKLRTKASERISHLLSLILQVLPMISLYFWGMRVLARFSLTPGALQFFSLAYFFGTTATLFMNTYFGHAIAAVFATALLLSVLDNRWFLAGSFFGWGMLSDYGSVLFFPAVAFSLFRDPSRKKILKFLLGGMVPGFLWIAYHHICFGNALTLPNRFQNPLFIEPARNLLWGIFGFPSFIAFCQLLFGPIRGILFTQPWCLIVVLGLPILLRGSLEIRKMAFFLTISFGLLLTMNASFFNWHAGGSPGPRYLCAVFPAFAIAGAYLFSRHRKLRPVLVLSLLFTLAFGSLVFASHRLQNPEDTPVWLFFFQQVFLSGARMPVIRLLLFLVILSGATWATRPKLVHLDR